MKDAANLVADIEEAFADAAYPGDNDIVRCEHDKRWGGTLPGPCMECSEVVDEFRGTNNRGQHAAKLRGVAFALKSFSDAAFVYWLPSFLIAAVTDPHEADFAIDSITEVFTPPEAAAERRVRFRAGVLSGRQLHAVERYFRYQLLAGHLEAWEVSPVLAALEPMARVGDT